MTTEQHHGFVISLYISPKAGAPMQTVEQVAAIAGRGLEGDRYFLSDATKSTGAEPGQQVTLIEAEALEVLRRDFGVDLDAAESRRNIATRGISLDDLVGRTFRIGEAELVGVETCEPCAHMTQLSGKNGTRALRGLVHRVGLRAEITVGGTIRVGDRVEG